MVAIWVADLSRHMPHCQDHIKAGVKSIHDRNANYPKGSAPLEVLSPPASSGKWRCWDVGSCSAARGTRNKLRNIPFLISQGALLQSYFPAPLRSKMRGVRLHHSLADLGYCAPSKGRRHTLQYIMLCCNGRLRCRLSRQVVCRETGNRRMIYSFWALKH